MLPGKTAHATRLNGSRINVNSGRDAKARNAKVNIGGKPRGAIRKTGALAPSAESRLKKAAREAFHLGGED